MWFLQSNHGRETLSRAALDDPHSAWVCRGIGELATREAEQIGIVFDPRLEVACRGAAALAVRHMVREVILDLLHKGE